MASYFERLAPGRFRATDHTAGAWSTSEQHFSPMAGLLTHAVERHVAELGDDPLVIARLTFDILGTIAIEEFDVEVAVVRSGRTIELVDVTAIARERAVVRGRVWRLIRSDTHEAADGQPPSMPLPDDVPREDMSAKWQGGFIASLEFRRVGAPHAGRARMWVRSPLELVSGEKVSELARFVALTDTANGVGPLVSPRDWFYPNVDLSIHLWRQPRADWVGLETDVVFGPDGVGLTSAVLHDIDGPVGRAEQTLTIRRT